MKREKIMPEIIINIITELPEYCAVQICEVRIMAKADYSFTIHLWGNSEEIVEIKGKNDLQEILDGVIDDIIGNCEVFDYSAELTNYLTGDTVKRESTKG